MLSTNLLQASVSETLLKRYFTKYLCTSTSPNAPVFEYHRYLQSFTIADAIASSTMSLHMAIPAMTRNTLCLAD